MGPDATRTKLPLWETVVESYRLGFGRIPLVVARYWPVLLVMSVVSVGFDWLGTSFGEPCSNPNGGNVVVCQDDIIVNPEMGDFFNGPGFVIYGIQWVSTAIFLSMIAVPWHALVLKNQPLSGRGLTLNSSVLTYAIWNMVVRLPVWPSILLLYLGKMQLDGMPSPSNMAYAGILLSLPGLMILSRLSIKVVAIALQEPNVTLRTIWESTSNNSWRMLWGMLLTILPLFTMAVLPEWLMKHNVLPQTLPPLTWAVFSTTIDVIRTLLFLAPLTFLSLAYRHLMMTLPDTTQ
jgi:hypothetical protein